MGAARPRIFHVSDRAGITRFEPRPPPSSDAAVGAPVVWGIDQRLLHNYLLPRDCPRVCFYARHDSSAADLAGFFGTPAAAHVVAIEAAWLERVRGAALWLYELPSLCFVEIDAGAGYHVSRMAVEPLAAHRIDDLLGALALRDVELRVLDNLWPLHDAVVASTLQFSCIRMRNAQPRPGPVACRGAAGYIDCGSNAHSSCSPVSSSGVSNRQD